MVIVIVLLVACAMIFLLIRRRQREGRLDCNWVGEHGPYDSVQWGDGETIHRQSPTTMNAYMRMLDNDKPPRY